MKISLRKKIILAFSVVILVGGSVWGVSDYTNAILIRKLQIIKNKNALLNTILEARRHEKNYFLYLDRKNLEQALVYTSNADQKLTALIEQFGRYTAARNLDQELSELDTYMHSLQRLLQFYNADGSLKREALLSEDFNKLQETIRQNGRKITEDLEQMVSLEEMNVNRLVNNSRLYLFVASIFGFVLCVLVAVFLLFNVHRPLKSLERAIWQIAQGDYSNIPPISAGSEFCSLVTSLNTMIKELDKRTEQLVQNRKMVSVGTLTSGVAHELNNPLNNISTSVQIALEELEEGNLAMLKDLLTETEQQVDRARDIVKALLEFSRERSFSPKPVPIADLIHGTIQLVRGEVPTNVELKTEYPADTMVNVDLRRVQQVLINLILNGVHAMEDGGVLTVRATEKNHGTVQIQVQDTGKGISEENLPKIFDPFFTTKDVGKGHGLGLSVSYGIIKQHHGKIEVASRPNEGTTFTIVLPGANDAPLDAASETDGAGGL